MDGVITNDIIIIIIIIIITRLITHVKSFTEWRIASARWSWIGEDKLGCLV